MTAYKRITIRAQEIELRDKLLRSDETVRSITSITWQHVDRVVRVETEKIFHTLDFDAKIEVLRSEAEPELKAPTREEYDHLKALHANQSRTIKRLHDEELKLRTSRDGWKAKAERYRTAISELFADGETENPYAD